MIKIYVRRILEKKMTIEEVPYHWRDAVRAEVSRIENAY